RRRRASCRRRSRPSRAAAPKATSGRLRRRAGAAHLARRSPSRASRNRTGLPIRSEPYPSPGAAGGPGVEHVLIVEDSPTMRALLVAALEGLAREIDVTEVASGFEALRRLPRERFDLIVTDVNMPDINGLELVSFVRRNPAYARVPLVIVSTEGSERDREKGMALGADAYLVKPFEPEQLQRVAHALRAARRCGDATGV